MSRNFKNAADKLSFNRLYDVLKTVANLIDSCEIFQLIAMKRSIKSVFIASWRWKGRGD
jgi:hypothetical protein